MRLSKTAPQQQQQQQQRQTKTKVKVKVKVKAADKARYAALPSGP